MATKFINTKGGLNKNHNQNHKLSQITHETLNLGIGIAKDKHIVRVQDD
ncbi:hypothetical protein [Virgibacillus sp. YIM 98842]|nr:hypothetical protein [Virgibacillus sp. YIM 98842]